MSYNTFIPIVNDDLVFYIDSYNRRSYVSGDIVTNDLVSNQFGEFDLINGVGFNGFSWTFDGVNDYVDLDPLSTTIGNDSQGSVQCWVKVNVITSTDFIRPFLSVGNVNNSTYFTFGIRNNGTFGVGMVNNGSTRWSVATDSVVFEVGVWINVCVTHNGVDSTIYINGIQVPQTYSTSTDKTLWFDGITVNTVRIGCQNVTTPNRFVNGDISNLKYYKRPLSLAEVLQNYNANKWRFQ